MPVIDMGDHTITSPTTFDEPRASDRLDPIKDLARALGRQSARQMGAAERPLDNGATATTPTNQRPKQSRRRRATG